MTRNIVLLRKLFQDRYKDLVTGLVDEQKFENLIIQSKFFLDLPAIRSCPFPGERRIIVLELGP